MSLYHETAEILSAPTTRGGSLKSRVFGKKGLKSPPAQVFALAMEASKWSEVLKEVVESAELLRLERKLTPILALLLVHDFLLSKGGISLPQSHGLRAAVERHKGRLASELTRARLRRKSPSIEALRAQIDADSDPEGRHPRWVRVNALKTDVEDQLGSTFKSYERVLSVEAIIAPASTSTSSSPPGNRRVYIDEHVPYLVAVSPGGPDLTKTEAYQEGKIILQDKASCFPAYLLDPHAQDGDVIDSCAAPGNKTTHLAAILHSHRPEQGASKQTIFALERDEKRALTLEKMVKVAGSRKVTRIGLGQDFLDVDPRASTYANVGALLLDPSCSGSGIVGRDAAPKLHLPEVSSGSGPSKPAQKAQGPNQNGGKGEMMPPPRKRKREDSPGGGPGTSSDAGRVMVDDDGNTVAVSSEQELQKRLQALSAFQLSLVKHAMAFPAARKITYSTCSIHAEENERVVMRALESDVAVKRGWRVLKREEQVRGMREWPIRGDAQACGGDEAVAGGCIRTFKGDGRGVMGFFVAGFVREGSEAGSEGDNDDDGPYVRDEEGRIVRDVTGMPVLKATGEPVPLEGAVHIGAQDGSEDDEDDSSNSEEGSDDDEDDSGEDEEDDDDGDGSGSGSEWGGIGD